ncbi:transglutaminase family protein [Maridesulfovibrio sp.]|uniref:transglutaminase family protein n=1 Tax=Maridesulfovibrio sp. TaxID=2795000 RepID=UPI002A188BD0|nr:transglutaminase family protein [Maridesulfovibrio sp.]
MRFTLRHLTRYSYSRPVFIEPHTIHLTPRQDSSQHVLQHELLITPAPTGRWDGIDAEGNPFTQVWFDGTASEFLVEARTTVQTLRDNPFSFLLCDAACHIPPKLSPEEKTALGACLRQTPYSITSRITRLAEKIRADSQGRELDFVLELNTWIFENIAKIIRREPGILSPEEVCNGKEGACRDSAGLFIACCRQVGIPARFVSGYQAGDPESADGHDLHAWAEAYIPGAGWIGLDPTHGLVVADRHVALAASHDPELTAPTCGHFRGTGADCTMTHELHLSADS